ncbi:MAG: hypothetical protein PVJ39_11255 [Gammaproteobacteria bacterium]|jgi:hypothetical protein
MPAAGNKTRGTRQRETLNRATDNRGSANRGFGAHVSAATARRIRGIEQRFQRELGETIQTKNRVEIIPPPIPQLSKPSLLKPEPVSDKELQAAMDTPNTFIAYLATGAFPVQRGDVVPDINGGNRLIVHVDQYRDIFYIDGTGAWFQYRKGFINDVWWGKVSKDVAGGTAAIYKLIYLEWQFIKGIIAAASWSYWASIVVFDIMEFATENPEKIKRLIKAFKIWNRVSGLLYLHCPTLFTIFHRYMISSVWPYTPESIDDANIAKRLGVFVAGLLKSAIKKGKITTGAVAWHVIKGYILARVVAMPKALKIVLENAKNPFVLIEHFAALGMEITPQVAHQIKAEYERFPATVEEALRLTNDVVEILSED